MLKNAFLYTIYAFVPLLFINIIFSFKNFISIFEKGILMGLGVCMTSFVVLFIAIYFILLVKRLASK